MPSETRPYKPKVLIYSQTPFLVEAGSLIHSRFECMPIQIRDPKQILPSVYEHMPVLILAEAASADDPAMDLLSGLKRDPVLEYIPVIIAAPKSYSHAIFSLATAAMTGPYSMDKLAFSVASTLVDVEHQLDMNPFSTLPGHHTCLRELENAVVSGGDLSAVTIRIRNLEIFGAMHSALSADVLADQIVQKIRESVQSTCARKCLIGHLGWPTFVTLMPAEKAHEFRNKLIARFNQTYESMVSHATQSQFTTALDSLKDSYVGSRKVELSVAILPLKNSGFHSAEDVVRASSERHAQDSGTAAAGTDTQRPADFLQEFFKNGRIETYFQPIVDCWEKKPFAFEALSRFIRPDGSMIHPEVVFSAARESGLVNELDLKCMDASMKAFSAFKTSAKIFLNVDRSTFTQMGSHLEIFDRYPIPHDRLILELTEQSLMGFRRKILEVKELLMERGILVAFDDAGTGDVSFREVGEFKPAYIKFERKLITGITRSPIKQRHVLSMRAFSRGIGAMTIAEGVEMPSELEYVKKIRLNFAQGYHIARPAKEPAL